MDRYGGLLKLDWCAEANNSEAVSVVFFSVSSHCQGKCDSCSCGSDIENVSQCRSINVHVDALKCCTSQI